MQDTIHNEKNKLVIKFRMEHWGIYYVYKIAYLQSNVPFVKVATKITK